MPTSPPRSLHLLAMLLMLLAATSSSSASPLTFILPRDNDATAAAAVVEDATTTGADEEEPATDLCALEVGSEPYSVSLHIIAVFTLLAVSLSGILLPPLVRHIFKNSKTTTLPLQCAKAFGAGVILATAFVHMFTPANELLTNPCLPTFFTETYTATAAAIALLGALSTHLFQVLAAHALTRKRRSGRRTADVANAVLLAKKDDDAPVDSEVGGTSTSADAEARESVVVSRDASTADLAGSHATHAPNSMDLHHHHHHPTALSSDTPAPFQQLAAAYALEI
ncbi:high-affinity Zn(2+) transporter zrt1, partial [Phlyctochytrium bullatum]